MLREVKTAEYHYFEDSRRLIQGEFKRWYKTGQLMSCSFCVDDFYHGEYKQWFDNGNFQKHCFYVKGIKTGEYKEWDTEGNLRKHCLYLKDKAILFSEIPYPVTDEDRLYFTLKYNLPLLPVEAKC